MFNRERNQLAASYSVMRLGLAMLTVVAALAAPLRAAAQATIGASISSPIAEQVLQGSVQIVGTADLPNFASAELDFGYASDASNTWFVIQTLDQPVVNGEIANWQTSSIADGAYVLRLRVSALDGNSREATVRVQVRNYTAAPVANPTAAATLTPELEIPSPIVLLPSATPEPTLPTTPTALPPNPAASTAADIYGGFVWGAALVLGLFILVGLVLLRRRS